MRLVLVFAAAIVLGVPSIVSASVPRTGVLVYAGGIGGFESPGTGCEDPAIGINGGCLGLDGTESWVDFAVHDVAQDDVCARYWFLDSNGQILEVGSFVGSVLHVSVPTGSDHILVFIGDPAPPVNFPYSLLACPTNKGTVGIFTASFT